MLIYCQSWDSAFVYDMYMSSCLSRIVAYAGSCPGQFSPTPKVLR